MFDFEQFKKKLHLGKISKNLRSKMIESPVIDDRELLQDLTIYPAQGQAKFKASCSEIVSLEGLAVRTQFSKNAENNEDREVQIYW